MQREKIEEEEKEGDVVTEIDCHSPDDDLRMKSTEGS